MHSPPRPIEVMCLVYSPPGRQPRTIGLLLLDREQDSLLMRFRTDWPEIDAWELDILSELGRVMQLQARELAPTALVMYLRSLSNALSLTAIETLYSDNPAADLDRLERVLYRCEQSGKGEALRPPRFSLGWQWLKNTMACARNEVREMSFSLGLAEARYIVTSGVTVLTIIATCNSLIQNIKPTIRIGANAAREHGEHPPSQPTIQTEAVRPTTTKDSSVDRPPLPGLALRTPDTRKALRTKKRGRHHAHIIRPTRQFTVAVPQLPEPAIMLGSEDLNYPAHEDLNYPAHLVLPGFMDASLMPLMPPERPKGIRRLLQAIAYPFVRAGKELAN